MAQTVSAGTVLVTGASRGIGKGVAVALADAGYRVYATGRSIAQTALPEGVDKIVCDHRDDLETGSVLARIEEDGPLDVLVNAAWGGYERMVEDGEFTWLAPFWGQPMHRWASMMDGGVRAAFVCSAHASRLMIPRRRGLIVNLGAWAAQRMLGNVIYGVAKAATDKMTSDMAEELAPHGVAVISLYPGLVRTEAVLQAAAQGAFDLANSESPQFIGRVIAALNSDPQLAARSGKVVVAAALAREFGILDIDGKSPSPLALGITNGTKA
jgi:dehydrogenase/reductase SDR family member 1